MAGGDNLYVFAPNTMAFTDEFGLAAEGGLLSEGFAIAQAGTAEGVIGRVLSVAVRYNPVFLTLMLSGDTPQNTSAKISPRANVLSRDHVSRKNYGGDCTPHEHDKLNAEMHQICDKPTCL